MMLKKVFYSVAVASFFSPLSYGMSLNEAFLHVQKNSPIILAASYRSSAQIEQVKQEQAGYLPTLDVYSSWGKEKSRNSTVAGRTNDKDAFETLTRNEGKITLKQFIFDGLETQNRILGAKAESMAEVQNKLDVQESTFFSVVQVYMDVLRHQMLLDHGRDYVSVQKAIADKVDDRASTGYGDKADQLQASSRLRLARAELRQIERDLASAKASFERVVGVQPEDLSMPDTVLSMPSGLQDAVRKALSVHPSLKMAEYRKDAAEKNYEASKGRNFPEFGLELSASRNRNLDGSKSPSDDFNALITMNYNLFRGGADKARIKQRAEQMNESMQEYQETYRKIKETVSQSWFALDAAQKRVKEINGYADEREQVKNSFFEQYQVGRRSLLNLLDSEQESFNARKLQVNEQFTLHLEKYRLVSSMGVLASSHKF
ncbi:hypothetical protein GZ77_09765 [Endozoicomonas montiporae]|uniref:Agglutination protein n=2 Tax=Endozoicomonas montiporae TaxID=1027273 RepID=A0A081N826_9GAMM|nr:TolC family outer membrane protein [Endozoicomonas montiporae]AMO55516.1 outer membrane protein component LapE [Endozoicomonas montiporae CL-33]KEQ14599.1 hypothetical protein GZ77_09765 [Endozoicomonas montiporae]